MAVFPTTVTPSMVSAPEIIDVTLEYNVDQGYSIRRPKWSRPRRRWTLEFLGKTVDEMRQIRDFLMQCRLEALDFAWSHPTAIDKVIVQPTTPVTVLWRHGLYTGMWVSVFNSPNPGINNQTWQITRVNEVTMLLNGTVAAGIQGPADVIIGVPHAKGVMHDGVMESPTTLIGPEQIPYVDRRGGTYSFSVQIEELF